VRQVVAATIRIVSAAELGGADTRVVLFRFGEKLQPGGMLNITLWADDVELTAKELKAKGCTIGMFGARRHRTGARLDCPVC